MKNEEPEFSLYRLICSIGKAGMYFLPLMLVLWISRGEAFLGGEIVLFPCLIAWKYLRFQHSKEYKKYFKKNKRERERILLKEKEVESGGIEIDCSSLHSLINDTLTKTGARENF